jgi:hypothetical protein
VLLLRGHAALFGVHVNYFDGVNIKAAVDEAGPNSSPNFDLEE